MEKEPIKPIVLPTDPVVQPDPTPEPDSTDVSLVKAVNGQKFPVNNLLLGEDVREVVEDFYEIAYNPDTSDFYGVYFDEISGNISISLYSEPLAEMRLLAEQKLAEKLNITDEQMCVLEIKVFTYVEVSKDYGNVENLGLSFCSGSVLLP